jgi:FkbM family methyltransferase
MQLLNSSRKAIKAWWRRHQLARRGIVGDAALRSLTAGHDSWDSWQIIPDGLNERSIVYSFGIGDDASFDLDMIQRFGAEVHGFDPTPEAVQWIQTQSLPPEFKFHPLGLAAEDGELLLYPPRKKGRINYSQEKLEYVTARHQPIGVPVERLATIMQRLGHDHVDVLKIDIEGGEFEAIPEFLRSGCQVQQLLVEIHYHYPTRSLRQGVELINQIKRAGFTCFYVSPRALEFGFIRR